MEFLSGLVEKITAFFLSFTVAPTYIQAGAIVLLIFLLILSLAQFRQHFIKWSFKGGLVGLFFGILLTLIIEGFFLVNGHTALTTVLGWKSAPKPISTALDIGKGKLTNVLGVGTENATSKDAINLIQSLNPGEIAKIKTIICTP